MGIGFIIRSLIAMGIFCSLIHEAKKTSREIDFKSEKLLLKNELEHPYHFDDIEEKIEWKEKTKKRLEYIEKEYYEYNYGFGYWFKTIFLGLCAYVGFLMFFYFGLMAVSTDQEIYKCNPKYDKDCTKITQEVVILDDNINAD